MNSKIDIWLSRISQLTQVGLFILAFVGFFYTVIPLYQNAVLNEAIAKKQVQLNNLEAKLNNMYVTTRKQAVDDYIFSAGAQCSGLMVPPENPVPLGSEDNQPDSQVEFFMKNSISQCLEKMLRENNSLSVLRSQDLELLKSKVTEIGRNMEIRQSRLRHEKSRLSKLGDAEYLGKAVRDNLISIRKLKWE